MATETATTRASDADRERVAALLSEHVGQGRLSMAELDERMTATYGARTLGDLETVLADLPSPPSHDFRRPGRPERQGHDLLPRWIGWAGTGLLCLLIWASVSLASADWTYFWPVWVIGPWGLMLLAKTVGTHTTRRGTAPLADSPCRGGARNPDSERRYRSESTRCHALRAAMSTGSHNGENGGA